MILMIYCLIVVFILVFSIYNGFKTSFLAQVLKSFCVGGALLIASKFGFIEIIKQFFIERIAVLFDTNTDYFNHNIFHVIAFLIVFFVFYFLLYITLNYLTKSINIEGLKNNLISNKILTMFFAMIQSFLIVTIAVYIVHAMFFQIGTFDKLQSSPSYSAFVSFSEYIF